MNYLFFWTALTAIGTIAMAATTFIALRKNSQDNENNRQLQLNVLTYQQQMHWMDRMRDACLKNIWSYNIMELTNAITTMQTNMNEANRMIVKFMAQLEQTDTEVAIIGQNDNDFRNEYHALRGSAYQGLCTVAKDMQTLMAVLINKQPQTQKDLIEGLNFYKDVPMQLKTMVQEYDFAKDNTMIFSVFNILDGYLANKFSYFETVRDFTQKYLRKEQDRINKILTDGY